MLVFFSSAAVLAGCAGGAAGPTIPGTARAETDSAAGTPPHTLTPIIPSTPRATEESVTYVALGDSYTIGTSVRTDARWPNQLVRALRPQSRLRLIENLGVNGYTSAQVISEQLPELDALNPSFVSILIGVNDVVQGVASDTYRQNVQRILDDLRGRLPADRILVVSTPDYTLTTAGALYPDPAGQSARIAEWNGILRQEAESRGLMLVDITPVADRVPDDPSLVARDELHPSGKQYAGWVELIAPAVRQMLAPDDQ